MKVMMVDRDPSGHAMIAEKLTQWGCHLLEVGGGEEALEIAHEEKPEIAIVDVLTPKLDRGDFICQLRRDPVVARMPVIFYTDGYLEVASGAGRDVDLLLTPMLLCEAAIRGKVMAQNGEPVASSETRSEAAQSEPESVQEVFSFVCGTAGHGSLIRLGDLISELVEDARKTFPKSIEITSAYSEDLWLIEGDRSQLHRALSNLFLNAREAMSQGGQLLVWAHNFNVDQYYASMTPGAKLGEYVMLRVSDTGRGTPRPVIDNVFNPYLERKEVDSGTSLGLIMNHGGFMSVYSQLERGTTFQIFLPARATEDCEPHKRRQTGDADDSYLLVSA